MYPLSDCLLFRSTWNLDIVLVFCTWKKTGEPGEKPSEQSDQQPPTREFYSQMYKVHTCFVSILRVVNTQVNHSILSPSERSMSV